MLDLSGGDANDGTYKQTMRERPMSTTLDANATDITVTGLKAVASLVPGVGGLVGELIGQVIPGQRLDRVATFLRELESRLETLERAPQPTPEFVDLFEDATLQSLKALSAERIQQLATFVAKAAPTGGESFDVDKRLLQILSDLTDSDLEVLKAHTDIRTRFRLEQATYVEPLAYGPYNRLDDDEKNQYDARRLAMDLHIAALVRSGLLIPEIRPLGPGPNDYEFDRATGQPVVHGHRISSLGTLLLRRLGALSAEAKPSP